jgi:hypothetical protein
MAQSVHRSEQYSLATSYWPVPSRSVDCGEPVALSATERFAEKPLTTDGVKVM